MIYKIFRAHEWAELQENGQTGGAPIDLADGFIHFSTARQVGETAAKHFAKAADLYLAAIADAALGEALKWEVSRGGARFPHLYRRLDLAEVIWCVKMPLGERGHEIPSDLP